MPNVKYFFGKVTMYPSYHRQGRDMILYFLKKHFEDKDNLITPMKPLEMEAKEADLAALFCKKTFKEDYKILNCEIRKLGYNIPPLVNAYMSLSPTMRMFGTAINYGFGDVEETGILIAVDEILAEKRIRHIQSFIENEPEACKLTSSCGVFKPTLRNNSTASSYGSRKFLIEGAGRSVANSESADFPLIRLAEVHLIYAEATCELGNGSISDEDLNFSINKNRERARVAPLTNALIANVWDAGWFDHATGKTICKKMNMLDEIRRERACELFGEGFRLDDLKRWGIAHINLTGQKLGHRILGTAYETEKANDANYFGEPCYYPEKYPLLYGIYEGTGPNDPDYGRSIATLAGNLNFSQRDYLQPIPRVQIRLNPQLKQNPGW